MGVEAEFGRSLGFEGFTSLLYVLMNVWVAIIIITPPGGSLRVFAIYLFIIYFFFLRGGGIKKLLAGSEGRTKSGISSFS